MTCPYWEPRVLLTFCTKLFTAYADYCIDRIEKQAFSKRQKKLFSVANVLR